MAGSPLAEKAGPGLLRFTDEDDIAEITEIILVHGDPRPADRRENATPLQLLENLAHSKALHDHTRHPDDVGTLEAVEVNRFHVLVDDGHLVLVRSKRGEQGQAENRHERPFADDRHDVLHAPVRDRESRIDEHDVSHGELLLQSLAPAPRNIRISPGSHLVPGASPPT